MVDIEKVIKGLEICTKDIPMSNTVHKSDFCKECPYYNAENRYCWNQIVMMRDALALLKEHLPSKVKTVQRIMKTEDNGTYFTMIWYECEECGHKINGDDCFCAGCGKEVDRSKVIYDT